MLLAKLKFHLLIGTMVLIWCGNFIALKICLLVMPPFGVAAYRVTASAFILLLISRYWGQPRSLRGMSRKDYLEFSKLALFGLLLNQTLFVIGLSRTTVAHSAIVVTFGPLFTLLFAWMKGEEILTRLTLLGMFISIVGIVFLNFEKDFSFRTSYLAGDFLTLAGSIAFAYYTVISKKAAFVYGALNSTLMTYLLGACLFLPLGLPLMARVHWLSLTWSSYLAFFYVAGLSSVLAQLIFYYALRHISASKLASLSYFQPVFTTASSVVLLSERPSLNFVIGGTVVIGGIILTQRKKRIQGKLYLERQEAR
jgi:drug/metabolite transporter (DMT)-like permease